MNPPTFKTIDIGDELPVLNKPPITEIQLVRYSGASGDFNPIHTVHQAGVEGGNGGVITHGMVIMGFCAEAVTNWVRPEQVKKFGVRFTGISKPGDEITVSGRVTERWEEDGEQLVAAELEAVDQTGHRKVMGRVTVTL